MLGSVHCEQFFLKFANSEHSPVNRKTHANIMFDNTSVYHPLYPVPKLPYDLLLGLDYCKRAMLTITCLPDDVKVGARPPTSHFMKSVLPVNMIQLKPIDHVGRIVDTVTIPPRTTKGLQVRFDHLHAGTAMLLPTRTIVRKDKLICPPFVGNIVNNELILAVANTGYQPITLHKDSQVCELDRHEDDIDFIGDEPLEQISYNINKKLSTQQAMSIRALLSKHNNLFARSLKDLKMTNVVEHHIDLIPGTRPIVSRPYRMADIEKAAVETQIVEMLKYDIIRPSKSPFASPIVMVRKKDGKFRFCIDFRRLNKETIRDQYPLPKMDVILRQLSGQQFFSNVDLFSGFWQLGMAEDSKHKTAFVTHDSLYEFNRLPFGLTNAPSIFQRLMDRVLMGLRYNSCLVYLDDVVIFGKTFEEHNANLEKVFHAFRRANLKLNAPKCTFGMHELNFLGQIVTREGIKPDPEKIAPVQNVQSPKNVPELRSFLGFCSYYRCYIRDFAKISLPLNKLLHKDESYIWTDECESTFKVLKELLISPPILAHFDSSLPIVLACDASGYAVGAVLAQIKDGKERVISYHSRTMNVHEVNYSISEKECLAMVFACKKNRHLLLGRHFLIRTDHQALIHLENVKETSGRLMRWSILLSDYDFSIQYKKGSTHTNADFLSRIRHQPKTPELETDQIPVFTLLKVDVEKEQKTDDFCKKIRTKLESKDSKTIEEGYVLVDNVLKRKVQTEREVLTLTLLPKSLLPTALRMLHDNLQSGHLGLFKTLSRVRARFYRPKLATDVARYVSTCEQCQARKYSTQQSPGPLQKFPTTAQPFQMVGIDFQGPLPLTSDGNQYILVLTDKGYRELPH